MSDLISRSVLLKYMETNEISQYIVELNKGNDNYNSTPLYDFIKDMPTAYDVEKVVAELPTYEFGVSLLNTEKYVKLSDLKKKIDAIRKGGVE